MYIVWGTKTRQEDGGVVADWCDVCRTPNFHRLIHFYKVSHVYYIPLGKGTYAASNRQCIRCGTTCSCSPNVYTRSLTHQEAFGQSIEQVLAATNPVLLEQIQKQRSLEQQVAQRMAKPAVPAFDIGLPSASPIGSPTGQADQRMLAALQTLKTLDARDREVVQFTDRLQKWDYLTPSEREVLLHELDVYATEDRKVHAALYFMRMLSSPTPSWISCTSCLGTVVVLIVALATIPFLQSWLWGSLFFVFSVAGWFFLNGKASDYSVRRWVRNTLLPRTRQHDVDLRFFVSLLAGIKGNTSGYEERIVDMARNVDTIADELRKQGQLSQDEPPALP